MLPSAPKAGAGAEEPKSPPPVPKAGEVLPPKTGAEAAAPKPGVDAPNPGVPPNAGAEAPKAEDPKADPEAPNAGWAGCCPNADAPKGLAPGWVAPKVPNAGFCCCCCCCWPKRDVPPDREETEQHKRKAERKGVSTA